jgi:hypothetical protein
MTTVKVAELSADQRHLFEAMRAAKAAARATKSSTKVAA